MSRRPWRQALWALAVFSSLAPSLADGNIGCLFSGSLCIKGVEWCYDDAAFGKCIPIYDDQPEDGSLYQYDMTNDQLKWFETELQKLVSRGYRWDHAFTQCVLQAMLYTLKEKLDIEHVNTRICDHFIDPELSVDVDDVDNQNMEADETAYIRYTPENSARPGADFASEVYSPPLIPDDGLLDYPEPKVYITNADDDQIQDMVLMKDDDTIPVIVPFGGFRERLQAESAKTNIDKKKKSIPLEDEGVDEERLGAHYRKHKIKPLPYTAEYITSNRFSPLEAEVQSKVLENYRQRFAQKNFPFEYENPDDNELPEPRVYFDEDPMENGPVDGGSGEVDPTHVKETPVTAEGAMKNKENLEYVSNHWKLIASNLNKMYAEGGPLKTDLSEGVNSNRFPEDLQGYLYNEWGFKRRERDDVKKPGPLPFNIDQLKFIYSKNVTDRLHKMANSQKTINNNHEDFQPDTSAYVTFSNDFGNDYKKGVVILSYVESLIGLEKNTFVLERVNPNEITFKVLKNKKDWTAEDVAREINNNKDEISKQTGAHIVHAAVRERIKRPAPRPMLIGATEILGLELPVFLALLGSLLTLIVGTVIFTVMLRRDMNSKRKLQGLSSAAEIDAEATRDYQELCRARMSGKWSGPQPAAEGAGRLTSLSKDDNNAPSNRSSTSSWSEEPALTNMDISTGHMVLAYMEDHLRNKDRLEQEWRALCAYEAEPCATNAALKPENANKNRYSDVLPYDHSRVTLNTLSNHVGSDYINASTITDHDPRNPAYIAAAGPLAHTAPDFWQMVWEQGSVVMVMLTRLSENGTQLCHRYWPEDGSQLYHMYEVHLVSEHIWCDDYLVRSFYLKNQKTGETRTVTQFHFLSWPENGVPASTKALLEFRRKVNKSYRGRSCPIVVHCSDGAGRTGTYCLIDMVLNRMAKGAKEIDIAATLEHIRDQRPRTVATKQQFEFVLMAVAEEVHAILKALPAHLQQQQEKKEKEKETSDK